MRIYEIDREIERILLDAVDEETGEVKEGVLEQINALQMERETKVENLALAYKNLKAEANAIKAEEDVLAKRRKSIESKAENAKKYLEQVTGGENFRSPRAVVSYRVSQSVKTDDGFEAWASANAPQFLRVKTEPNRTAIGEALKSGQAVEHACIVESVSMSVR